MNCFANTLIDGVLLICYTELKDEAEKQLIHDRSRSPYRNFVRTDLTKEGRVLYIMAVDETAKIQQTERDMRDLSCYNELKICVYESDDYPGNSYIKVYDKNASREHMTARLKELAGLEKTVMIATSQAPEKRYGTMRGTATDSAAETRCLPENSDATQEQDLLSAPDIMVGLHDGDRAVKELEWAYEPYFWKK